MRFTFRLKPMHKLYMLILLPSVYFLAKKNRCLHAVLLKCFRGLIKFLSFYGKLSKWKKENLSLVSFIWLSWNSSKKIASDAFEISTEAFSSQQLVKRKRGFWMITRIAEIVMTRIMTYSWHVNWFQLFRGQFHVVITKVSFFQRSYFKTLCFLNRRENSYR